MEVGVDIIEIDRFDEHLLKDTRFLSRLFTKAELSYCMEKANPAPHLAARFAGKEAAVKALHAAGVKALISDIEITRTEEGIPGVHLLMDNPPDLEIRISLSHSNSHAIAFAIIEEQKKE